MIEFEQEEFKSSPARIKVIGVGGAGGNAVKRMIEAGLSGIEFYAVNTDHQALRTCVGATQIQIGMNTTRGLGAGANPEIGRKAAEENRECLQEIVDEANMIFITAGMGGGTGTGAAPFVASLAREKGVLTIGIVTRPFDFEGRRRAEQAEAGLQELRESADSVIVVSNQRLIDAIDRKMPVTETFREGDKVLLYGVQSISDIITEAGEINVDFADVETIMRDAGTALMGMGRATGDHRAQIAAELAISSPLLEETNIQGATGMIVNVTAPPGFMMHELDEAMKVIRDVSENAEPIIGLVNKNELELDDEVLVTVIATGFDSVQTGERYAGAGAPGNPGRGGQNPATAPQRLPQTERGNPMLQGSRIRRTDGRSARNPYPKQQGSTAERQPIGRTDNEQESSTPASRNTRTSNRQANMPIGDRDQLDDIEQPDDKKSDTGNKEKPWDIPTFLRVHQKGNKRRS